MSTDLSTTINYLLQEIKIINDETGQIQIDVAVLKTQMAELFWWFRAVMGALIALGITQFWQIKKLIKNGKNNK